MKQEPTSTSNSTVKKILILLFKIALTVFVLIVSAFVAVLSSLILFSEGIHEILSYAGGLVLPLLLIPLIWVKKRKKVFLILLIPVGIYFVSLGINFGLIAYDKSITIDTSPNIDLYQYLPFEKESKIVKLDNSSLRFTENLPIIDGAAAVFPVYSAFVHATYPDTVSLYDGIFEYNNTPEGYKLLAERQTDIFIGAYPSEQQRAKAEECGTTFVYTPIGWEAFVFFVHKDNPINSLSIEEIQGIYSGKITNWKEVGGKNEKISAFQRNEGSGSQSMLKRFMKDIPIMEAPTELKTDLMSGIIEEVSDYKSTTAAIGFSFRYYVEEIIQNPDIKMISIDGIAPTAQNLKNGTYPVIAPLYAVSYKEQTKETVAQFLEWMVSEEGQYIIEETGYVGLSNEVE